MTIAFVEPHVAVCGGIRRVIEFSNRLTDRGHSVTWFIPDRWIETKQTGGWMEQKFNVYGLSAIPMFSKFDVVVFNEETQYPIAQKFPATVKVYYALHWAVLHKDYNVLRNCYNGGFRIIANSNWTADAMLLETGARPPVVYGGVNEKLFHPVVGTRSIEYDIGTYGASRLWKGAYIAKDVARQLGVSLFTFGDDSKIPQEKMAEAYHRLGVYLSTSWYEGWNWPGLEAMACGVPLVISDDGGSRDYAKNGYNCLVYPARDIEKATEYVRRVLNDNKLYQNLVTHGLETAKLFRWDKGVDDMEKLFEGSL